ncbi:SGNH/GDSL hydrolase family protein [Lysobacter sp. LF1]|uniref:SGNH/GDSL hydrolase family protein n=1 Tax=Lysobacter stagni TaxID=3045172 RepID=A0ABT6XHG6_9GAMM|nr:SGNH/GDSL hydrolase family protein [Lysobacter sp. LF1]MDI9239591.1 SGNH/GDSL hydrolase family protein [Lysobacter sp. LF1]
MTRFVLLLGLALLAACSTLPATRDAAAATANDSAQFEPDIAAFERVDSGVRRMPGSVVFVGSSSIRLWDSLGEDFPGVAVINRGFGGSRVRDSTYYADRIVTPYQPRAIVFYAGDNDLQEGRTPRQVRDDFVAFVERVRGTLPQVPIAFIAIKPSPSRVALLPQVREANALVRAYAAEEDGIDFLDVYLPMLDGEGQPRDELFLDDQLHMNRSGYAIWAGVVRPWLAGL